LEKAHQRAFSSLKDSSESFYLHSACDYFVLFSCGIQFKVVEAVFVLKSGWLKSFQEGWGTRWQQIF